MSKRKAKRSVDQELLSVEQSLWLEDLQVVAYERDGFRQIIREDEARIARLRQQVKKHKQTFTQLNGDYLRLIDLLARPESRTQRRTIQNDAAPG